VLHAQPQQHRTGLRIGQRRTVAEEFRHHVELSGQPHRLRRLRHRGQRARGQPLRQFHPSAAASWRLCGRMQREQMIDGRARRRLPAFVEHAAAPAL
jgi:hypothetical protein